MEKKCFKSKNVLSLCFSLLLLSGSPFALAATTLSNTGGSSNCGQDTAAAISAGDQQVGQIAQGVYQAVPQPEDLSSSTCFSSILSMGDSIGLSFFNPQSLISDLEQMACNAAQSALQWPESQVNNAINQYGQLPDGLGGVNASSTDNGSGITTNTNNDAGGPSVPSIGSLTNNSTLSGALGG